MKRKIAVLTSGWTVDYVLSLIEGMNKVCKEKNVDLYIFICYKFIEPSGEPNTTSFSVFDLIDFNDYDGAIVTPNIFNDEELLFKYVERIKKAKIPAVSIGREIEGFHTVINNNKPALSQLINHLIKEHDVKTFAYFTGPKDHFETDENISHIKNILASENISTDIHIEETDWSYNSAYTKAVKLFQNKASIPQAVIGVNDGVGMAIARAATESGLSIPADIKVVGLNETSMSTIIIPSLTTIKSRDEEIGKAAVELLLENPKEITKITIDDILNTRQSCGCVETISKEQIIYSQGYVKILDTEQRFSTQLRFLEDRFLKNSSIPELCNNLQLYFQQRHSFEGENFAVLLDKKIVNSITDLFAEFKNRSSYSEEMQTIVNIQEGQATDLYSISTSDLLPPNMHTEEASYYVIFPIFNQKSLYGYYVARNYAGLLYNKQAYNWIRNLGAILEKYRQTSVYRGMSEQLKVLSMHDSLSGLYNRSVLETDASELFDENNRKNYSTDIVFVDINDMKIINDKYGHLQGDLAIKTVAEAISNCLPENYISLRYGGDEFVIIGTGYENFNCEHEITKTLKEKVVQMKLPYELTVSIGTKRYKPNEANTLRLAIAEVDALMYKEKIKYHMKRMLTLK